jgi:DNA-nicking Smr family endonuclease
MYSSDDLELWQAVMRDVTPLHTSPTAPRLPVFRRLPSPSLGHTLDLHGMTLREAYAATNDFLVQNATSYRYVTIITGLSGRIRYEFRHWLAGHPVQRIEELNGGGSVRVYFRKKERPCLKSRR